MMSAHCHVCQIPAGLVYKRSYVNTYVVQCASRVTKLNDLDGSHESVDALVVEARVASGLESGFEVCATSFLEAEKTSAGLVEHFDERDVEVCYVGAESEVDCCEGMFVGAVDQSRAASYGPYSACMFGKLVSISI